ncbi:MAG: HvfC/BufC family peptide modification chaperone, partial [Candidatus Binatia bacterium]
RELIDQIYAPRAKPAPPSLAEAERASPQQLALGLAIYRRNLIFGLCRAMAGNYPLCRDLLGEGNFGFLCKQYVHDFPSRVRDLGDYGERFAELLAERSEVREYPYLVDVARLEWLCERAIRLPREAWLERGELAADDEANRARVARSVLLLRTTYTIVDLWSDHRRGGVEAIRPETICPEPQHLVVWSEAGSPQVSELGPELWGALAEKRKDTAD